MVNYTLTRSNRKTAAIYIRSGSVEVRAPLRMPKRDIDRFVLEKEHWILKNLSTQQSQAQKKESFVVDYGSFITFRGKQYPVIQDAEPSSCQRQRSGQRDSVRAGFDEEVFYMPPGLSPEQIKSTCIQLYKMLAKAHISKRVSYFSSQMGVMPSAIKINSAMRRWGSCSSQKSLNFSWRLIMADDSVIDYVVVHELSHIKQMNHSARFWAVVESVLPDYRESKIKLKELQHQLSAEDWK